jgi:peptidyl-tRNA hydrolase, PTH2 family
MSEPKQVIIIRKDLHMRKGKMCAQAAHASMAAVLNQFKRYKDPSHRTELWDLNISSDTPLARWLSEKFTKICVYVTSEEELLSVYQKAQEAKIICSLITDAGLTEFGGVPTHTAVAIGPAIPEVVDNITGELPLL